MRGPPPRTLAASARRALAACHAAARPFAASPLLPTRRKTLPSHANLSTQPHSRLSELVARLLPVRAAAAATDAATSDADLLAAFDAAWDAHVAALRDHGHWREVGMDGETLSAAGALKHAHLEFARARPDVLHSLPSASLAALLAAPLPYVDRKTTNAAARLAASVVEGATLEPGAGGAATTADVVRLLLAAKFGAAAQRARAAAVAASSEAEAAAVEAAGEGGDGVATGEDLLAGDAVLSSPAFVAAALDLLPTVGALMAAEPEPAAAAAAAEAAAANEAAREAAAAARAAAAAERGDRASPYERRDRRDDRYNSRDSRREPREPRGMKPGDWSCPECDAHNFASRTECFSCGAPVPEGAGRAALAPAYTARPGDWACSCGASNFAWREACYTCGGERPADAARVPVPARGGYERGDRGDRYDSRAGGDRPPRRADPGDWYCAEGGCGAHNFRRRTSCFLCGAPKGANAEVVPGDVPSAGGDRSFGERSFERREPPPPRDGDWACPSCAFNNFASRTECFRCGTPAPEGMGGQARPARSSGGWQDRRDSPRGGRGGGGGWRDDRGGGGRGGGRDRGDRGGGDRWSSSAPVADEGLEW